MANSTSKMMIDTARAMTLASNFKSVAEHVSNASKDRNVRLVAVSKLKPATDILSLHQGPAGVEHFGENYAQELSEKSELLPRSIKWHFIGGLQSNKCKPLASTIPNLWCVSSVDSIKKANQLEAGRALLDPQPAHKLHVHVQVNTSGEAAKSGCAPGVETLELCRHVVDKCPHLNLLGLMTIGAIARSKVGGEENEDFKALASEKESLERELQGYSLELSMGMSNDFELAIEMGSGEVRVGSTIFGERPPKEEFKVKGEVQEEKS